MRSRQSSMRSLVNFGGEDEGEGDTPSKIQRSSSKLGASKLGADLQRLTQVAAITAGVDMSLTGVNPTAPAPGNR
eukprot:2997001-Pyramimonas_sp.AAC.1